MTQGVGGQSPPQHRSKPAVAKEEAAELGSTAAERGGEVAHTAAEEAKHVAAHAQREGQDLLRESREHLVAQAREGQQKAARGLHDLADQLGRMSEKAEVSGTASDVTRQVAERAHSVAGWLESREPGDLLGEVRDFARRKPGVFLAGAVVAGAVVGRLTRGVVAGKQEQTADSGGAPAPSAPPRPSAPPVAATPPPVAPTTTGTVPPPATPAPPASPVAPTGPGGFTTPQPAEPADPRFPAPGQVP
ncbi:hypothetical protein [Amycolatopsis magusensis]|uniref:hypothetical protein n=1 Tax=Amycolatopsis magusensis TaxID=882444 RepID=UPI0024A8E16D|nr:hypothetical protein [Amycolatopsis magusensis]MDI5975681.1 hypothetical protein [Amycolatopsis magusensis]